MGSKRGHEALNYSDNDGSTARYSNKRQRNGASDKGKQSQLQPTTDLTYGQRCVFPNLGDATVPTDDDLDIEDEGDALAYLRSVRLEANGIPQLLVAPKAGPHLPPGLSSAAEAGCEPVDRSIYKNGLGDSRGYYQDGAYTAVPDAELTDDEATNQHGGDTDDDDDDDAVAAADRERLHEACYASLASQFTALQQRLHRSPPPHVVEALPRNHGTVVGSFGPRSPTFRIWTNRIRYTDPLPAQVAAMDKASVLKLLRIILGGKFLRRGYELRERTSRWIWALLARLPGPGEMDYTEVGWVRELGKRAVLMLVSIAQMAALKEEVDEGALEGSSAGDADGDEGEFVDDLVAAEEGGGGPVGGWPTSPGHLDPGEGKGREESTQPSSGGAGEGGGGMDTGAEDGEVSEGGAEIDLEAEIAAAKARLLAQLDSASTEDEGEEAAEAAGRDSASFPGGLSAEVGDGNSERRAGDDGVREGVFDELRSRVNMRATLNMILTIAGGFYGQRDLLEFRDPFTGL